MEMNLELVGAVAPYAGVALALNFLVLLLKKYLPQYESIKSALAIIVGVGAVIAYFVSNDLALFTALASSCLTWEILTNAYGMVRGAQKPL